MGHAWLRREVRRTNSWRNFWSDFLLIILILFLQNVQWEEMFTPEGMPPNGTMAALSERNKRRLKAVWELFHSELVFLIRQLLVLRCGKIIK